MVEGNGGSIIYLSSILKIVLKEVNLHSAACFSELSDSRPSGGNLWPSAMTSMGMRQFGGGSELVVPPSTEDLRDPSRCGSNLSLLEDGANSLHYSNPTLLASPAIGAGGRRQQPQPQNQSLVETRFNGTPQLVSPCEYQIYRVRNKWP